MWYKIPSGYPSLLGILKLLPGESPHHTQTPTFPAMTLTRKHLDHWFGNNPYGKAGLRAEDLGALEDKCEKLSQQYGSDTELWTWKFKLLVMFQT